MKYVLVIGVGAVQCPEVSLLKQPILIAKYYRDFVLVASAIGVMIQASATVVSFQADT